jgi:hypothetical protein
MTQPGWDDDERLLGELAQALRETESLARTVAEHGHAALSWRTIDEELLLASLTFDSSLEPVPQTRAEQPDEARVLVFTSTPLSMELEVLPDQVVGQILPPAAGEILIETSDGAEYRITADESGFFELPSLPDGPVRLRCDTPTGRVVTDWVRL